MEFHFISAHTEREIEKGKTCLATLALQQQQEQNLKQILNIIYTSRAGIKERKREQDIYIYVKFECVRKRLPVWNECRNIFILHMIQKFSVCNFQLTIFQFFWVYRNFVEFCFGARERESGRTSERETESSKTCPKKWELQTLRLPRLYVPHAMAGKSVHTHTHRHMLTKQIYVCSTHTYAHTFYSCSAHLLIAFNSFKWRD